MPDEFEKAKITNFWREKHLSAKDTIDGGPFSQRKITIYWINHLIRTFSQIKSTIAITIFAVITIASINHAGNQ